METNQAAQSPYDPAQALADVAGSREAIAARLVTPAWYHPILGANLGLLTWLVANTNPIGTATSLILTFASLGVSLTLIAAYKRLTGVWVGYREVGPRTRRTWAGFGAVIAALMLVDATAGQAPGWSWLGLPLALVALVVTIVIGRRLDATMREEIRDGSMPVPGLPR